jgi:hypothetical protein
MQTRILAFAICNYSSPLLNNIPNSETDVRAILQVLTQKYEFDDVELHVEPAATTRKKIHDKIRDFFTNALPDENILLLYAGHGQYDGHLKVAYWQPSDATHDDPCTWYELTHLISCIRASKAHHISIINDSCFSGALLVEPSRGGGINAYSNKASREALASGGLQTVSDGPNGDFSPFAKSLLSVLEENEQKEKPFALLANEVIMRFSATKNQTPMFGALTNVGHSGGSFIFKLKAKPEDIAISAKAIKEIMGNLYINQPTNILRRADELRELRNAKLAIVKNQRYAEAANVRLKEKSVLHEILDDFKSYLALLRKEYISTTNFSKSELQSALKLDNEVQQYLKRRNPQEKSSVRVVRRIKMKSDLKSIGLIVHTLSNPVTDKFAEYRNDLAKEFSIGVMNMYNLALKITGNSHNTIVEKAIANLHETLGEILVFQLGALAGNQHTLFEYLQWTNGAQSKILQWIKNPTGDDNKE